jgi:hypothetical protein
MDAPVAGPRSCYDHLAMSSWGCPHQLNEICQKVRGAYCRPGMRGCVLAGRVTFHDGVVPFPEWPPGADPRDRAEAEAELGGTERSGPEGKPQKDRVQQ